MNNPFTQKTITISCKGATEVDIDGIFPLQGALKTLMEEDYLKLRTSIETLGFSDPLSIWVDETGKIWIHDGHERVLTLKKMREEGYTIPHLPASIIEAKDKVEAKKKLLANDSRFGKITQDGLTDFINEEDSVLNEAELFDYVDIPEFDLDTGEEEDATPGNQGIKDKEPKCEKCTNYHERNHDE